VTTPAIAEDGTLYAASHDHNVYAIDSKTGKKKGSFKTDSTVSSSPTTAKNGTVYIGSDDHNLYALKIENLSVAEEVEKKPTDSQKQELTIEKGNGVVSIGGIVLDVWKE
jgi:outer membrane protein assembly factor BamB